MTLFTDDDMERGCDGLELTHDHVYHVHASECCMELGKYTRAVLDAVLPAYRKRVLLDLADAIHRGPTFPIPPSVISALLREKAEETP